MFKGWREHFRRCGVALTPELEARHVRCEAAYDAAVKTFGSDDAAGQWMYRHASDFGEWVSPAAVAGATDQGLQAVLAHLEAKARELGPVPPRPEYTWPGKRSRRRGR